MWHFSSSLCAVCHHSENKLAKPPHLKLSSKQCSTNWLKCCKVWAQEHTHTLQDADRWVFIFGYIFSLLAVQTHITRAHGFLHTHKYKANMYTHTNTVQWPSLCWVGKESGVSACCQPVRERKGEGKGEDAKEQQTWLKECRERWSSASWFNKKTNAITGGPYLSWLMLADRVAAI